MTHWAPRLGDSRAPHHWLQHRPGARDAKPRDSLSAEHIDQEAHVEITIYFRDREPAGPYRLTVPARRTFHLRFDELRDPEPVPLATDYASVIRSDVPIVVQHTRLDSRQAENALMTTVGFPGG